MLHTGGFFALAVAPPVAFVVVERSLGGAARPSQHRVTVRAANVVMFLVAAGLFAMFYFNTLYLQRVLGYSALEAGLAFLPLRRGSSSGRAVAEPRTEARCARSATIGMPMAVVGLLLFMRLQPDGSYVTDLLPGIMLGSIGMGLTFVPITLIATSGIPADDAGLASGLYNTSQQIGGALGLAILATLSVDATQETLSGARARTTAGADEDTGRGRFPRTSAARLWSRAGSSRRFLSRRDVVAVGEPRNRARARARLAATMPTLGAVARAWGRIGVVGFGGPPAHIALLRDLVVDRRTWMPAERFEDGLAAANLPPGPASTQLAIYTAWWTRGLAGAVVGGLAFILPGLVLIVALAALFLGDPPDWIRGAGGRGGRGGRGRRPCRASAAQASLGSRRLDVRGRFGGVFARRWSRRGDARAMARRSSAGVRSRRGRLAASSRRRLLLAGALPRPDDRYCHGRHARVAQLGRVQGGRALVRRRLRDHPPAASRRGRTLRLDDGYRVPERSRIRAGHARRSCTRSQRSATRPPVFPGSALAAVVAFAPSFAFAFGGARSFDRLLANPDVRRFFDGAGAAAIGAILGSAIPLSLALQETWQWAVLAGAAVPFRRSARRRPHIARGGSGRRRGRPARRTTRSVSYQPDVPRSPLNGPTTSDVIQPP